MILSALTLFAFTDRVKLMIEDGSLWETLRRRVSPDYVVACVQVRCLSIWLGYPINVGFSRGESQDHNTLPVGDEAVRCLLKESQHLITSGLHYALRPFSNRWGRGERATQVMVRHHRVLAREFKFHYYHNVISKQFNIGFKRASIYRLSIEVIERP